jgi:hypothetical protein
MRLTRRPGPKIMGPNEPGITPCAKQQPGVGRSDAPGRCRPEQAGGIQQPRWACPSISGVSTASSGALSQQGRPRDLERDCEGARPLRNGGGSPWAPA